MKLSNCNEIISQTANNTVMQLTKKLCSNNAVADQLEEIAGSQAIPTLTSK